jgi:RNA polymerase sigma factor for flagellar operon FliA
MTPEDIDALWHRYKTEPTPADREALILVHVPLVRYVAGRMMPGLHSSVEYQDLVSYGMFGLMDAIEKFKLDAGTKFSTFATYRIRGAITDEMRDQAWEPRSVRARSRVVAQAMTDLERKLGRPPTEVELATHVEMPVAELRRLAGDLRMSRVSSINKPVGTEGEGEFTVADTLVSADATDLHPQVGEAAALVAAGLGQLAENERILMLMIYVKGMALKEIARVLEVTESWVSLLHTRAMVNLQRTLSATY